MAPVCLQTGKSRPEVTESDHLNCGHHPLYGEGSAFPGIRHATPILLQAESWPNHSSSQAQSSHQFPGATRWPKDQGCCRKPTPRSSFQGSSSRAVRQVSLLRYSRPARRWGPGTGPLHPRLQTRAPRRASGSTPPRPLEDAVQGPGCSAASARRCHPPPRLCRPPQPQPRPGGGVRRLGGTGGRAGTQAPSCTRAGQRRGRGPSGRTKREIRRCHCPRRWRVTPGRLFRPGAPRSTPHSTSGAPRRSNSCSRPPAACSSHIHRRPRSQKPGELLLRAVHSG